MVYRELRETCSKLGEEMFSKSAEAGSKGNYFSCFTHMITPVTPNGNFIYTTR